MKKEEKQLTIAERIQAMPLDPEYKPVQNLPIPLGKGVLVKPIQQTPTSQTESGIILMGGENSHPPHLGIVYAIGPLCSEYVRVGLRVYFNFFVDSSFYIDGVHYAKMDEHDVYYIVPPKAIVFDGVKSDKEVRQEKKLPKQQAYLNEMYRKEQNEKDAKMDSTKGKIRIIKP